MNALETSGCAKRLMTLTFERCNVQREGIRGLGNLFSRNALPALKHLCLRRNPGITDEGVAALAEGLLQAEETFLESLELDKVGMSCEGFAGIVNLLSQGGLRELKKLDLCRNSDVTNEEIVVLARSIDAHGLPMLEEFRLQGLNEDEVTLLGSTAIALAVITRCRNLKNMYWMCPGPYEVNDDMIAGMLKATGRVGEVMVTFEEAWR